MFDEFCSLYNEYTKTSPEPLHFRSVSDAFAFVYGHSIDDLEGKNGADEVKSFANKLYKNKEIDNNAWWLGKEDILELRKKILENNKYTAEVKEILEKGYYKVIIRNATYFINDD
jgi:hypothetical protein